MFEFVGCLVFVLGEEEDDVAHLVPDRFEVFELR